MAMPSLQFPIFRHGERERNVGIAPRSPVKRAGVQICDVLHPADKIYCQKARPCKRPVADSLDRSGDNHVRERIAICERTITDIRHPCRNRDRYEWHIAESTAPNRGYALGPVRRRQQGRAGSMNAGDHAVIHNHFKWLQTFIWRVEECIVIQIRNIAFAAIKRHRLKARRVKCIVADSLDRSRDNHVRKRVAPRKRIVANLFNPLVQRDLLKIVAISKSIILDIRHGCREFNPGERRFVAKRLISDGCHACREVAGRQCGRAFTEAIHQDTIDDNQLERSVIHNPTRRNSHVIRDDGIHCELSAIRIKPPHEIAIIPRIRQ